MMNYISYYLGQNSKLAEFLNKWTLFVRKSELTTIRMSSRRVEMKSPNYDCFLFTVVWDTTHMHSWPGLSTSLNPATCSAGKVWLIYSHRFSIEFWNCTFSLDLKFLRGISWTTLTRAIGWYKPWKHSYLHSKLLTVFTTPTQPGHTIVCLLSLRTLCACVCESIQILFLTISTNSAIYLSQMLEARDTWGKHWMLSCCAGLCRWPLMRRRSAPSLIRTAAVARCFLETARCSTLYKIQ